MHVINIGTELNYSLNYKVSNITFFSKITFLDAEMIFWNISHSEASLLFSPLHKSSNTDKDEFLEEGFKRKQKELSEFFEMGKTLVLQAEYFNRKRVSYREGSFIEKIVNDLDFDFPKYEEVQGINIEPANSKLAIDFYNNNYDIFNYSYKVHKSNGTPLMYIKGTKYVVSEYYKVKNGYIIILPNFKLSEQNDYSSQLISAIDRLVEELKKSTDNIVNEIPEWVSTYKFKEEESEFENFNDLKNQVDILNDKIKISDKKLSEFNYLKGLFSCTGDTLEGVVKYVLEEFGFELEKPEGNRSDLIIKSSEKVAVVEVKGLTKSAAERNAAQLQKWVSDYHIDNNFSPKGILIINTFKDLVIEERLKKHDFPNQMLAYSKKMEHCLISGLQLFCIYLDFKQNIIDKSKVIDLLFDTVGELKYTDNPMNYMQKIS